VAKQIDKLSDQQLRRWMKAGVPLAKADGGGLTFTLSAAVSQRGCCDTAMAARPVN